MSRLTLRRLELQDFCCFADQALDFAAPAVLLVQGVNADTGSGSGCGKSRLLRALAYAVGVLGPAAKPHARWGQEEMEVCLTLGLGDKELLVRRGTNGLALEGAVTCRGEDAKTALQKFLGLPRESLEALTYRRQRRQGYFLALRPAQQQEFLRQVLGLGRYDQALERQAGNVQEARNRVAAAQSTHQAEERILRAAEQRLEARRTDLDQSAIRKRLDEVRVVLEQAVARIAGLEAEGRQARATYVPPSAALLVARQNDLRIAECAHREAVVAARQHRSIVSAQVASLAAARARLERAIRDGQEVLPQVQALLESRCPICAQEWQSPEALAAAWAKVEAGEAAGVELPAICDQEATARAAANEGDPPYPSAIRDQVEALQRRCERERMEATAPHVAEAAMLASDVGRLRAEERSLQEQLAKAEAFEKAVQDVFNAASTSHIAEVAVADAQLAMDEALDVEELLKGWLVEVLAEVLAEVAQRANDHLAAIPNVRHCVLALRTAKDLKKGGERRGVHVVVLADGEERELDDLSGGQQSAVELAVDLAVAEVVQARTGCFPGWMVLDEPFDGMTQLEREAAMQLLKDFAERAQAVVLVVDHSAELKTGAEQGLWVEMQGGVATVCYLDAGR